MLIIDHEGNEFKGRRALSEHWGIKEYEFTYWLKKGYSIENAIAKCKRDKNVYDHEGTKYATYLDMCKAWNCSYTLFKNRTAWGWELKDILTTPANQVTIPVSIQGVEFGSLKELCRELGFDYGKFLEMHRKGMTIEECMLVVPSAKICREGIQDHLGYQYDSLDALCADYEIPKSVYVKERLEGKTKKEILTSHIQ